MNTWNIKCLDVEIIDRYINFEFLARLFSWAIKDIYETFLVNCQWTKVWMKKKDREKKNQNGCHKPKPIWERNHCFYKRLTIYITVSIDGNLSHYLGDIDIRVSYTAFQTTTRSFIYYY